MPAVTPDPGQDLLGQIIDMASKSLLSPEKEQTPTVKQSPGQQPQPTDPSSNQSSYSSKPGGT